MIKSNGIYVDKTPELYNLLESEGPFIFCTRVKRMGKTLNLDTIKCLYEGENDHELFKGTWIYENCKPFLEKLREEKHPVLLIEPPPFTNQKKFLANLETSITRYYKSPGFNINPNVSENINFERLIKHAYYANPIKGSKEGRKVVILIDEYDKPIIDALKAFDGKDKSDLEFVIKAMHDFYLITKTQYSKIHKSIMLGTSKFSGLSILSGKS